MSKEDKNIDIAEDETDYDNETEARVFREKHCVMCGKVFCRANYIDYAYKIPCSSGHRFFCSWTCMRKYQRLQEEKRDKSKDEKRHGVASDEEAKKKPPKYDKLYETKRRKI